MIHPRDALLGAQGSAVLLPVCDHYSGVEARMVKSLQLQLEMMQEFNACVFDVTLDCEDGAPVGSENDQANMVAELANSTLSAPDSIATGVARRVGVRVHPVNHPAFATDVQTIVGRGARALSYLMIPKVESLADVQVAVDAIDSAACRDVVLPVHVLVESPAAVNQVFAIAAHPRVESISFGLMDFVSAHGGAIPGSAMGVRTEIDTCSLDQFHHPLVVRAKSEIASACHAFRKVPSHCVVTEFHDVVRLKKSASMAARMFGYTRMWSIHPDQIRPILEAFSPDSAEIDFASTVIEAGAVQEWAPVAVQGKLQDRASYRYYWHVLERAHQTGCVLPSSVQTFFTQSFH